MDQNLFLSSQNKSVTRAHRDLQWSHFKDLAEWCVWNSNYYEFTQQQTAYDESVPSQPVELIDEWIQLD